jgi:hypothetical protein
MSRFRIKDGVPESKPSSAVRWSLLARDKSLTDLVRFLCSSFHESKLRLPRFRCKSSGFTVCGAAIIRSRIIGSRVLLTSLRGSILRSILVCDGIGKAARRLRRYTDISKGQTTLSFLMGSNRVRSTLLNIVGAHLSLQLCPNGERAAGQSTSRT